jgi:DnaJ-class molecular chaperone
MPLKKSVIEAFETLGLTPDAEYANAAKTYKKLALQHHPDRNHGDSSATQRFQKVRVYNLLSARLVLNACFLDQHGLGYLPEALR